MRATLPTTYPECHRNHPEFMKFTIGFPIANVLFAWLFEVGRTKSDVSLRLIRVERADFTWYHCQLIGKARWTCCTAQKWTTLGLCRHLCISACFFKQMSGSLGKLIPASLGGSCIK